MNWQAVKAVKGFLALREYPTDNKALKYVINELRQWSGFSANGQVFGPNSTAIGDPNTIVDIDVVYDVPYGIEENKERLRIVGFVYYLDDEGKIAAGPMVDIYEEFIKARHIENDG